MPHDKSHNNNAQRQAVYRQRTEQARKAQLAAKGLPALPAIPTIPGYPRWKQIFAAVLHLMQLARNEMQNFYNQRSEQWLETDRAERMQERLETLDEILDLLNNLIDD